MFNMLIVDDDPEILSFIKLGLEEDFIIHTAEDGLKAVELACKIRPEILIVDLILPSLDGYDVVKTISTSIGLRERRVVAMTGFINYWDPDRAFDVGIKELIVKPFSLPKLKSIMSSSV